MCAPLINSEKAEKDGILGVAKLMLVAARTAPKSAGVDDVLTAIIHGKEKDAVADVMVEIAKERNLEMFKREEKNVRNSEFVVLVGVRGNKSFGLDCGACGFLSCAAFEEVGRKAGKDFVGPACLFKILDLGIALGSAAKIAGILNVDNRLMYRIGTAALKLKMLSEATVIMGLPLSAKGKNIYFDRVK